MDRMTTERLGRLLELVRYYKIPTESTRVTFMDVAGIGRKETAISKVLAFFLDSSAEHGMGELWIRSLLGAASCKNEAFNPDGMGLSPASCTIEDVTQSRKRIDVVVITSGLALAIENKIGAKLYNDLGEYASHIAERAGGDRRALLITLTVGDELEATERYVTACAACGVALCNVRYRELFDELKERMGSAYLDIDTDWLVFMRDFMRTLEDAEDPMAGMDEELFKFVGDNKSDFKTALKILEAVANQQRAQSQNLCFLIEESGVYEKCGFTPPGTYLPNEYGMWCTTHVDAKLCDSKGEIHPAISNSTDEMLIRCWCSRKADVSMVMRHLSAEGITAERSDDEHSLIVSRHPLATLQDDLVKEFDALLQKLTPIVQPFS